MDNKTEIIGFEELARKIKQLPDKVTRSEVVKIQRRIAKPVVDAYRSALPESGISKRRFSTTYESGNLRKSVRAITVPGSKVDGNPMIVVRPSRKGKYSGYYKFMAVRKGTKVGSTKTGSRKGKPLLTEDARNEAYKTRAKALEPKYVEQVNRYIDKTIQRLSND